MTLRTVRTLAGVYLVIALLGVTWPGLAPVPPIEPLVLGLPFSMAWIAGWVLGVLIVLVLVDRVERRHREASTAARGAGAGAPGSPTTDAGRDD